MGGSTATGPQCSSQDSYFRASPGETWICSLTVNHGSNGTNYFAILQDKVETASGSEDPSDKIEEASPAADEYTIVPDPEEEVEEDLVSEEPIDGGILADILDDEFTIVPDRSDRRRFAVTSRVQHVGPDTLYSNLFSSGLYIGYCSMDGSMIQLIRSERGDIPCVSGTIRIAGLDEMLGTTECCLLPFVYRGSIIDVYMDPSN